MKVFNPSKHQFEEKGGRKLKGHPSREQQQKDREAAGQPLDDALEETFPASDPPASITPKKREGSE
ncbi:MAG TPA: hypothetical protein VJM53_07405 [Burkholderiales bacterium]|jgi:hypothetical protein|nr:hypothetical protein [Burkholderiales bacterium]